MMEKNKNRADLLAVGRKKLQQFRQKKDGKGNTSRSSVKGSKSGHETTSSNDNPDEVSQRAGIPEILPLAVSARLPLESSGVNQTSLNQNAYDSEATQKDEPFYSVHDVISKEAGSCDPIIIVERAEDPHISLPSKILSETVRQHVEEQETDVGTMEIEIDKGMGKLREDHGNVSSNDLSEVTGDNKTSDSGNIPSVDAPLTGSATIDVEEAYEEHGHSIDASPMTDSGTVSTTSSVVVDKMSEDIICGSSNEEVAVILCELDASNASSHAPGTQTERLPELIGATKNSLGCKQLDFSSVLDGSVVKLSQLSGILRNLDEDDFRFLFMSGELLLDKVRGADKIKFHEFVGCNEFERFKEQLYVTCFLKDVFHLQLFEQQMLISEISAANASQGEGRSKNDMFAEEISQARHELQEAVSEREKLQEQLHSSKAEVERFSAEVDELQKQLEGARDGISALSSELVDCKILIEVLQAKNKNLNESLLVMAEEKTKFFEESMESKDLVVTLQMEISDMNGKLMSLKGERMRLEEEKESIYSEYEKQYLELVGIKISEAVLEAKCDTLKEVASRVDQLIEENGTISADLELHKLKLKDLEQKDYSFQSDEAANQGIQNDIRALQKPKSIWLSEELNLGAYGDSNGFIALKRKLDDAEIAMQKLEKEIDTSPSHLISLNRSSDKVVAPGVSKLIHAFESKHQADDHDPERSTSSENETSGDPYRGIKLIIENLRMLLKDVTGDAENAVESCTVTWSRLLATARADRSEYNSLREHTDRVEQEYIMFMVLHEAMREHISYAVTKEVELLSLCDDLQKQKMELKSENGHILEKLNDSQVKIGELQSQLDRICREIDDMVSSISTEVQILQEEVRPDGESFVEEQWNSVCVRVLQTVGVVDSTIKILSGNSQAGIDNNMDISSLVGTFIDGATRMIDFLHRQLEDAHRLRQETLDRNYMALHTLHTLYSELSGLVGGAIPENSVVADKVMDLLNLDAFNTLMDQLKQSSVERMQIESENKLLSSELANRAREANELDKKWIKSLVKLVEEIEKSVRLEGMVIDTEEPCSRLESLIHLLIQKCNEADQTLSLSTSLEMQLVKLQKEMDHMHIVLVQYENENFVLKQNLKSAEESVIALGRKAQEKTVELEMSEQKALSLREKLSIAVTKGKGLISQRESLKQSLTETSKELEKSSQELLFKDARLYELETKLKAYSEAGERMEALESELSYIRNSATALRESFLLKDSVLQRIEEVLEDMELPEQFHSGNIIEKIEWLAKSFGGNPSSPLGDMDNRSSVQGVSYTDAGIIGADVSKEDMQTNSDSIVDLRIRYEELQTKFYGLAEQNEMLEQSLLQRNHLVKMWEETLGMVNLPSQVQSMEPEYKIQWMESAFSEAQNHCYSLQKRIDDLEALCRSSTAYLEDSQGRTSELVSAFQQLFVENEVLLMISETLSRDNVDMLKKTIDLKTRNENIQNEVIVLREQKLQLEEDVSHSEVAIRMLQELVNNALKYSIREDVVQNQKGVEYLEETLKKLVEKYKSLSSDVNVIELPQTSWNIEEQDMVTLKKELEDSMGELTCMRTERNKYMEDNHLLLHKIEELERKEKELQDLLNQEELKSATFREKFNVAVRRGKSLVQKRDGLNQMIEELNGEVERLKSEVNCSVKAISEYEEQIKNLLTSQERVQVLESENASLRVHLAESKHYLQEKEGTWGSILVGLNEIDVGVAFDSGNPIEKLDGISKCLNDLRTKLGIHEQESRKSKKAAELLLTELNEVQERYDGLQEELAKAVHELSEVCREKDAAESAKNESLAHITHLEGGQREMQSTIINLQKELQEKDITREKICLELVTQIQESETNAKTYLHDLQQANAHLHDSQKQLDKLKEEREVLKQRLEELQHHETNSLELEKRVNSLTSALAAKAQETETLMQALEEQEAEIEDLTEKVGEMEKDLLQNNHDLENLDASRAKALKKLSVTVSKFDELHYLSESLLAEVEKLQTQLQERDGEISFLRKEVTRCTNDALVVTQLSKQRSSGEVLDLLSRLDALLSKVQGHDAAPDDLNSLPVEECKDVLEKKIMALISELENIHVVAQNNSMLLHEERCKVNELAQKEQYLKNSLREKESEIVMLQGEMESAIATKSNSDTMEAEQMNNKWASPANVVPQVRSLRKSNNDQVAIAIDMDCNSDRLDDDDDDKAHGFKSLTTSKIVPRFTRPVSDLVDGLWVSCDRALMRQPALRLGVIFYWALLHAMLATFVV